MSHQPVLANNCWFLLQKPFSGLLTGSQWPNGNVILASSDLLLLWGIMGYRTRKRWMARRNLRREEGSVQPRAQVRRWRTAVGCVYLLKTRPMSSF